MMLNVLQTNMFIMTNINSSRSFFNVIGLKLIFKTEISEWVEFN